MGQWPISAFVIHFISFLFLQLLQRTKGMKINSTVKRYLNYLLSTVPFDSFLHFTCRMKWEVPRCNFERSPNTLFCIIHTAHAVVLESLSWTNWNKDFIHYCCCVSPIIAELVTPHCSSSFFVHHIVNEITD